MSHTILFLQPGKKSTRTYYDFPSTESCLDGARTLFEQNLQDLNPGKTVQYTIEDMLTFYRGFQDVSMMILQGNKMYKPVLPVEFLSMLNERTKSYLSDQGSKRR